MPNNEFEINLNLNKLDQLKQTADQGVQLKIDDSIIQQKIASIKKSIEDLPAINIKLPTQQRMQSFGAFVQQAELLKKLGDIKVQISLPTESRMDSFVNSMRELQSVNLSNVVQQLQPLAATLQQAAQSAAVLAASFKALNNFTSPNSPGGGGGGGGGIGGLRTPPGSYREIPNILYDDPRFGVQRYVTQSTVNKTNQDLADAQQEISSRIGEVNTARIFSRLGIGEAPGDVLSKIQSEAARKYNLDPGNFTQSLASTKFFDLSRVFSSEGIKNVGAAGLISGSPAGAIGAAGAAAIFGPEAAFVGSQVGENVARVFESIKESMAKAIEVGVEYQRSINSIAAVLSQTTTTFVNGREATGVEAIQANYRTAREIQTGARARLLPLGISGESEAALVSSVVTGLASRGISGSAGQFSNISSNLGAAVAALDPTLIGNPTMMSRDLIDLLTGSSRASTTQLGTRLKNFAPELFQKGGLNSAADFERATQSLGKLAEVLTKSGDGAAQYTRTLGILNNLTVSFGDALLKSLNPALESLNETLSSESFNEMAKGFGEGIGNIISAFRGLTAAMQVVPNLLNEVSIGFKMLGNIASVAFSGGHGLSGMTDKDLFSGITATEAQRFYETTGKDIRNYVPQNKSSKDTSIASPQSLLESALKESGISESGIAGLEDKVFKKGSSSQLRFLNFLLSPEGRIGSANPEQLGMLYGSRADLADKFIQEQKEIFDLNTLGGRDQFARFQEQNLRKSLQDREIQSSFQSIFVSKAQSNRDEALKALEKATTGGNAEEIATAQARVRQTSEELAKQTSRLEEVERKAIITKREIIDAQEAQNKISLEKIQRRREETDTFTVTGQIEDLKLQREAAIKQIQDTQKELQNPLISDAKRDDLQHTLSILQKKTLPGIIRSEQTAPYEQANQILSANPKLQEAQRWEALVGVQQKFIDLSEAVQKANFNLKEWSDSLQLRSLGRQGALLASAKEALANGASRSDLSTEELSLLDHEKDFKKSFAIEQLRATERRNDLGDFLWNEPNQEVSNANALTLAKLAQAKYPIEAQQGIYGLVIRQIQASQRVGGNGTGTGFVPPPINIAANSATSPEVINQVRDQIKEGNDAREAFKKIAAKFDERDSKNYKGNETALTKQDYADAVAQGTRIALQAEFS